MSLFTMYVCVQEEDRELRCSGCEERSVRAHAAQPSFSSTLHQQQAQQYFDLITDIFCSQNTVYLSHNSSQQLKTNILLFSLIFLFISQFFYNCVDKILVLIWYIDQTQAFLQKVPKISRLLLRIILQKRLHSVGISTNSQVTFYPCKWLSFIFYPCKWTGIHI